MKRYLLFLLAMTMSVGMVFSSSVDVRTAEEVGRQFVLNNFSFDRAASDLNLVYTSTSTRGEACFYIFNVGEDGFVVVSGTDAARPVLAYSYEGAYDPENVAPAMQFWLDRYSEEISFALAKGTRADCEIAQQWDNLRQEKGVSQRGCPEPAKFLMTTRWNQSPYYNNLCPSGCPTGCVATAMAQIMKYWNHPAQGSGSHSYYSYYGGYQSANFGNTVYDWENMPASLSGSSSSEEVSAVATLMYHCGVSVDMGYAPDGSGAMSQEVPYAISTYFGYTSSADLVTPTKSVLKEQINRGWPMYYAAASPSSDGTHARHAFVCDGYDSDDDMFHFNLGWGGSGDAFYSYTSITPSGYNFNDELRVIVNFVPANIYSATAKAPTNLTTTAAPNNGLQVTLSWTNPSQTLNGSSLGTINQIFVERDGEVVYTQNNAASGQSMTWVDNVPYFSTHNYKVYAVKNGAKGAAIESSVKVGPTNNWKFMMLANQTGGFKDGYIKVLDAAGNEYARVTTSSSQTDTKNVALPLGNLRFVWHEPSNPIEQMSIVIRNAQNEAVFSITDASYNIPSMFLKANNASDNTFTSPVVNNVSASSNNYDVTITWDAVSNHGYGYNVYDNDELIALVPNATTYSCSLPECSYGGHCYTVTTLTEAGESEALSMSCVLVGAEDGCCPATNLNYEITSSSKIKLYWTRPTCSNFSGNKCGYYIYKQVDNGDWSLLAMKNANATNHTDNSVQIYNSVYHYKVVAVYNVGKDDECISIPANVENSDVKFVLDVDLTDGVSEAEAEAISIYPNPAKDLLNVRGEGIRSVTMFNIVGQVVYHCENADDTHAVELGGMTSGIYIVKVVSDDNEIVKRVSVVR